MGEGEKTTFITMLRDPVDVFESQWEYYNHEKLYGMSIGKPDILMNKKDSNFMF